MSARCGVLGADARVVEAGRDRVRLEGLAVLVLQEVAARAVQDAGATAFDRRGVPFGVDAVAGRLEPVELDRRVVEEGVEDADRVRAAADAGDHGIRKSAGELEHLGARLLADDLLEVAHHRRERMRARRRAEDVVGGLDASSPSRGSASLIASLRVREPVVTDTTSAPSSRIRATLSAWRWVSTSPMKIVHSRPNSAAAVAVATPC